MTIRRSKKLGEKMLFIFGIFLLILIMPGVVAEKNFAVTSFSCSPSETAINSVFSCTATIKNTGTEVGSVGVATLYPDSNDWLENSNYPQASGTSMDPGNSVEVTFTGLRAVKSGNNGFSKIMLDVSTDTYVASVKENVIDVIVSVSNSASSAAMGVSFDSSAEVTAGGNINVDLTFSVTSGGCSIGSQSSTKSITLQNGNKQSRSWAVTMGTSGTCRYTIAAAATGSGGIASKIDSTTSSVTCTNCPTSSSSSTSSGGGGGGGGVGTVVYTIGELGTSQSVELGKGEAASFLINGENHSITLKNLTTTEATVMVKSESQTFTIVVGDEKSVDLNGDGTTDFFVKLKSINTIKNKATFILRPLVEKLPEEGKRGAGITGGAINEGGEGGGIGLIGTKSSWIWIIILILAIVIAACVVYLVKSKKRRYRGW